MKETLSVGLCGPGRHKMPVTQFIFPACINPMDFEKMNATIDEFLCRKVLIHQRTGLNGLDQSDYEKCVCWRGDKNLCVYVTGLTAPIAALVAGCARYGVSLTLMHFNRNTGGYTPQHIFSFEEKVK